MMKTAILIVFAWFALVATSLSQGAATSSSSGKMGTFQLTTGQSATMRLMGTDGENMYFELSGTMQRIPITRLAKASREAALKFAPLQLERRLEVRKNGAIKPDSDRDRAMDAARRNWKRINSTFPKDPAGTEAQRFRDMVVEAADDYPAQLAIGFQIRR